VRPLKEFGAPLLDLCTPKPFVVHQAMLDPVLPHRWWYYFRSCDLAELTDDVIDITVEHALQIESPLTVVSTFQLGGAVARRGASLTSRRRISTIEKAPLPGLFP
jgi:hypothetical protein